MASSVAQPQNRRRSLGRIRTPTPNTEMSSTSVGAPLGRATRAGDRDGSVVAAHSARPASQAPAHGGQRRPSSARAICPSAAHDANAPIAAPFHCYLCARGRRQVCASSIANSGISARIQTDLTLSVRVLRVGRWWTDFWSRNAKVEAWAVGPVPLRWELRLRNPTPCRLPWEDAAKDRTWWKHVRSCGRGKTRKRAEDVQLVAERRKA